MNKQQLVAKIWQSANKMRSKIDANEYKDYILGFIFYKFLSDKEEELLEQNEFSSADFKALTEDNKEYVTFIQDKLGYFISYDNLFSTWLSLGSDFSGANVTDALSAFNRLIKSSHKNVFDKIFLTLETGLSKLGDNANAIKKAVNGLVHLIKDIPMDGKQGYDVLGFIYEELISNFAASAGKKAGEFYTPHEVSLVMSEIVTEHLKNKKEISIYDPTSGSGSLLINIGSCISKHTNDKDKITYYAQEINENTYNLTRMNLIMRGITPYNIHVRNADTLEDDWPDFDEDNKDAYKPLHIDAVVSNPPYSLTWDPSNKEHDERFKEYGLAPKSKADYAFLLHDLFHVNDGGIMTIVLPHGVLFRGGEEGKIRERLIEKNNIDAIIGLPANIFYGTSIPTIIMVLRKNKINTDVLIIDASKGFTKEGKNNILRASDIKRITDTVRDRVTINGFSKVVTRDEIRDNEYNLNIPRYIDNCERAESYDIYASMFGGIPENEIAELDEFWQAFPNLKNHIFTTKNKSIATLNVDDIKQAVFNDTEVKTFFNEFTKAFEDFPKYLFDKLIVKPEEVQISTEKTNTTNNMFERLATFKLIDKYEAYQILDDKWKLISEDLEMIQTEGKETIRKVDPRMVTKNNNGLDSEVQEGWIGRIIPFELVQREILTTEYDCLKEKDNKLADISSQFEELLDQFDEEEKESKEFSDEKDSFVNAAVKKKAKSIRLDIMKNISYEEDSYEMKILQVDDLIEEEKTLKKEIKQAENNLIDKTISTINSLTDEQINSLLMKKWINPIYNSLSAIPTTLINNLVAEVKSLSQKYSITMQDTEKEIKECEKQLSSMIDELTGNEFDMKGLSEFKKLLGGNE